MAGFYHFTDSNTDRFEDSGNILYCLKNPNDTMYNTLTESIKKLDKPIIVDIKEFGPAFVVPYDAWTNLNTYSFTINGEVYEINASKNLFMFPDELKVYIIKSGGR